MLCISPFILIKIEKERWMIWLLYGFIKRWGTLHFFICQFFQLILVWLLLLTLDELKQRLLYTTLELESVRVKASEEMRKNNEYVKQLLQLLKTSFQERDEARDQVQKLLDKFIPSKTTTSPEFLLPPPQLRPEIPFVKPAKANSSITESNSPSADTFNYQSPVNSFFDPVSSPDSSTNLIFMEQPVVDQGCLTIDEIVKGKTLPKRGKLLNAVLEAGPLLHTLFVSGPLPRWTNPPSLHAFHIPPVSVKSCEAETDNVQKQVISPSFVEVSCGSSQAPMLDFGSGGFESCSSSGRWISAEASASSYVPLGKRQRFQLGQINT